MKLLTSHFFSICFFLTASSTLLFAQDPVITLVQPSSGGAGTYITMYGDNLDLLASDNILLLTPIDGGATINIAASKIKNKHQLTFILPPGMEGGVYHVGYSRSSDDSTASYVGTFDVITDGGDFGDVETSREEIYTDTKPQEIKAVDLNGDGYQDLIYYDTDSPNLNWILNNGDGTFGSENTLSTPTIPKYVLTPDMNNDGFPDLLVSYDYEEFDQEPTWWQNNGDGTFEATKHTIATDAYDVLPNAIATGDFDNDGHIDLAAIDWEVYVFFNEGDSTFGAPGFESSSSFSGSISLITTDVDGDGKLDIVASENGKGIYWYQNNGNGTFDEDTVTTTMDNVVEVYASDLDNDGDNDLIGITYDDELFEFINDGSGSFTKYLVNTLYNPWNVAIADLNGDGYPDLVSPSYYGEELVWYENDREGFFTSNPQVISDPFGSTWVQTADLDNDGDEDVIDVAYPEDYDFISPEDLVGFKRIGIYLNQSPLPGFYSMTFDGTDDELEIPHSDVFNDLTAFTFEAWIKSTDATTRQGIAEKHVTPSSGWWIDLNNDITAAIVTVDVTGVVSSTVDLASNQWYHVAVTYSGSQLSVFLNGEDVSSGGSITGKIRNNLNDVKIGSLNWTSAGFNGNIDEIRIWDVARSEDEIRENMFQPLLGNETGLIAYYPLDEGSGSDFFDHSANFNDGSLSGDATWDSDVPPYGTVITGDEGWRMFASPVNGVSYGDLLEPLWTQGFTGADVTNGTSNVQVWDEATQSFNSISNATDIPGAGEAFLVYVFDDDDYDGSGDGFPKTVEVENSQNTDTVALSLSYTDDGDEDSDDDGWNLVGNPYGATINWDASAGWGRSNLDNVIYVWSDSANSGEGDYLSWNGESGTLSDGLIAPWQGFWVKANAATPSLSFDDYVRSGGAVLYKRTPVPEIRFTLKNGQFANSAILSLSGGASLEKDSHDAYKLQSLNPEYLSLFSLLDNGAALDINALPAKLSEHVSLDIDYLRSTDTGASSTATLHWNISAFPRDWNLELRDNETGEEIDLRRTSELSFHIGAETSAKMVASHQIGDPVQQVLRQPSALKAKTSHTPRFTLTLIPSNTVSNEPGSDLPQTFALSQNYPNPFNPSTVIRYQLPENSMVDLRVFDMLGREVANLVSGQVEAGYHQVQFNAGDLASGVYIYRLQAGDNVFTKKLTLIK